MGPAKTPDEETRAVEVPLEKTASHDEGLPSRQALMMALQAEKPNPWSPGLRKLYVFCIIAFLCSTMNGTSDIALASILIF